MQSKETILTHDDFLKFLDYVPKIKPFGGKYGKPPMLAYEFQMLFKLLFYCALKTNEVLRLKKEDFDLENNLLKVRIKGNVSKSTTVPPILWGDVKSFLKNKQGKDLLFISKYTGKTIPRQSVWDYAKDIGKLADLKVFQVTETREIEGVSLLVFRDSYTQFMVSNNALPGLVELKLRKTSRNRYGNNTIHDLKIFERRIFKTKLNDDEIQEYVNWYMSNRSLYRDLADEIHKILSAILKKREIKIREIKSREKDLESFKRKLQEGVTFNPKNMQDLSGIRIICFVKSDVKAICDVIENSFDVIDKKESTSRNDFSGYSDIKYTCKLTKARIISAEELKQFENKYFEIQIRTILQDAWSEIEHDDLYKNTVQIPEDLRRRFFLVSNVLESADNELDNLHHAIKRQK